MKKLLTLALALLMVLGIAFPIAIEKEPVTAQAAENVKTADIYFIAGQSNAAGYTLFSANGVYNVKKYEDKLASFVNANSYPDVLYYGYAGEYQNAHAGVKKTDLKPVTKGLGAWSSDIGPELGMADALQPLYKDNATTDAVIIKYAVGSSSLDGKKGCEWGNWAPPSTYNASTHVGENFYDNMVGTEAGLYQDGFIYDALEALKAKGYKKINFKGFFWAQGEAEKGTVARAEEYNKNLSALIKDFRADLTKMVENCLLYGFGISFSDPANLGFLISEICMTFGGAIIESDGTSSDPGIDIVLRAEREVATNTSSPYYVANTYLLNTQSYVIKKTGDQNQLSDSNRGSFCYDSAHYSGDDMIEIGINAGTAMYSYAVGDTVEMEEPQGFWIRVNGNIAMRTATSATLDVFQSQQYKVNVNKTMDGENISAIQVVADIPDEYHVSAVKYWLGNAAQGSTDASLYAEGNSINVPQALIKALSSNSKVFVDLIIELKPTRTINVNLSRVVLSEEISGLYEVGAEISFKVYLSSADYLDKGYVLGECSYNGVKLTPDADGVFTFTVSDASEQKLVIKATTVSFAGNNAVLDYVLDVAPGTDVPDDPETPSEPEQPSDDAGSTGMNCSMGIGSEAVIIAVMALAGAAIILLKKRFSVK